MTKALIVSIRKEREWRGLPVPCICDWVIYRYKRMTSREIPAGQFDITQEVCITHRSTSFLPSSSEHRPISTGSLNALAKSPFCLGIAFLSPLGRPGDLPSFVETSLSNLVLFAGLPSIVDTISGEEDRRAEGGSLSSSSVETTWPSATSLATSRREARDRRGMSGDASLESPGGEKGRWDRVGGGNGADMVGKGLGKGRCDIECR